MGWHNPDVPWQEFERALSWGTGWRSDGEKLPRSVPADPPAALVDPTGPAWAELHCHSAYSFLDGASEPLDLVTEAAALGVGYLAVTDHDGFYGAVRFAEAARELRELHGVEVRTIFGAELSLDLTARQSGIPDPEGSHLLVLARGPEGYANLSATITAAHMRGSKGRPVYDLHEIAQAHDDHWAVLTGCRKGWVRQALDNGGVPAAETALRRLIDMFGRANVYVEITDLDQPGDDARNDTLITLADTLGLTVVATNNVHYARPDDADLAHVLAATRATSTLDDQEPWLPATTTAHLRSGVEMEDRLGRFPGVREATVALAEACAFDLELIAPRLPNREVPPSHTDETWLRRQTLKGARERYGDPDDPANTKAYTQIEHELRVINDLDFPGYFLIVHEIIEFCRTNGILCQGRGSAANSAVCYSLGITAVDPIEHQLLFERFLTDARVGPPDIDIDIENSRREEVIQHVYDKYGRDRAAQVANVNSYRPRMALRDVARALGYSNGQVDAWSKHLGHHEPIPDEASIPNDVTRLVYRMLRLPRHLSIHSGGMVLCDRPVGEVCPVEWATMPGRSVVQWDKDDCAAAGLIKFDLLGLGMLSALRETFELLATHHDRAMALHTVPDEDPAVYAMLCDADSVGVFQVESRAQMATLPRLRPKTFYDLVVEVALIRPGPIQGGSVHPYIRRANHDEQVTYPHPSMQPALERTKGVPLFQEQMMQLAIDCAGFTGKEADELRQAMSSKRSPERIERLRERLLAGMAEKGIPGDVAEDIYGKLFGFASYGFPESHAMSFAKLVYASAYLKRYYPAAFTAALLNNQPMGFYAPQTLVDDARRHGVEVRGVDVNVSQVPATLEDPVDVPPGLAHAPTEPQPAIRMGLSSVRGLGDDVAEAITATQPFADLADLVRRVEVSGRPVPLAALESLATAGAFECFGLDRREALWAVGALSRHRADQLPGTMPGTRVPALPAMTAIEETFADLWATGVTPGSHPVQHVRADLDADGVVATAHLRTLNDGVRVYVGGLVTHRQRPPTAGGVVFLNLEDETGMVNVICPPQVWERQRRIALESSALVVDGKLESANGAINILATRLRRLQVASTGRSRDFR